MAKCPFLSGVVITSSTTTVSSKTITGTIDPTTGDTSLTVGDSLNTTTYINDLIQEDCITTNCQLWDFDKGTCGLMSGGATIEYLETVLGEEADLDEDPLLNKLSIVSYLKNILGQTKYLSIEEQFTIPGSKVATVTETPVLGKTKVYDITNNEEIVAGNPLVNPNEYSLAGKTFTFHTDKIGVEISIYYRYNSITPPSPFYRPLYNIIDDERDSSNNLLKYLEIVLGEESDLDEDEETPPNKLSLVSYFKKIIGEFDNLDYDVDDGYTPHNRFDLITYFKNMIGRYNQLDEYVGGIVPFKLSLALYLKYVIGKHGDLDSDKNTFIKYVREALGLDPATNSYNTLQQIIGYTGDDSDGTPDSLKEILGFTGDVGGTPFDPDTLKEALVANVGSVLKALGYAHSDLSDLFTLASDNDDLKKSLGFDQLNASDHLKSELSYLEDILGEHDNKDDDNSLLTYLSNIIGANTDKSGTDQTLLMVDKHIHDSHLHTVQHDADVMPASIGPPNAIIPKAANLIQEWMGKEDLDSNGAIYGVDFMIDPGDSEKPTCLIGVEQSPEWPNPACIITWQEYLDWLSTGVSPC